ncbi:hypothetical protein [Brevundimonas sp. Root1279]|uniref:hypothetical protein n=1 Tax=Brevundimonas sp. Root1279 TaxID=1736443 RepID=UPI0006F56024|nr:hypothetical protein [Brevundimonas sp. Root1279]KQW80733.1 hypothetical protein ASC65_12200 [Brevundimonas sp. Root1279]
MFLRPFLIPTVCALAALTAACDGDGVRISSTRTEEPDAKGALKVVDALQCPQTMGSLARKGSASAEGTICTYAGPRGAEVTLHMVKLNGKPASEALRKFEADLSAALPHAMAQLKSAKAHAEAEAEAAAAAGHAGTLPKDGVDIQANDEDATISMPGLHIESKGDDASVRIGGFHIDANDGEGRVNIEGEANGDNVSVQAHQDSAEIRTRAAGEATRASWILTDNRASEAGWRLVGYEARGPAGGPIIVATVRSRDTNRGRVFEDAKELVALNVGE